MVITHRVRFLRLCSFISRKTVTGPSFLFDYVGWLDPRGTPDTLSCQLSTPDMSKPHSSSDMPSRSRDEVTDAHFMEARAKLLDLAAFLDRLERAAGADDHRVRGLRAALPILLEKDPARVAKILNLWSDPTTAPIEKSDTKAASGVWPKIK